ncbi:SRPBCC family protein [Amycolatopsis rhabdoformis]|uniref:SRPBCC family protein n=1 Tax=Amycolatopsis rhabdoformis TaxID=1448059 RepID=A0ABZ1IKG3_9PSEU|nr:SRPBCC family protein [Amycolatopsis rhabdoformis]WSE34674.1 SRPBCC family protein [Amycolatopsis rhabdoformis]
MVTKQVKAVKDKATDTAGKATGTVSKAAGGGSNELTDALRGLGQAAMTRATGSLTKRISSTAGRLTDFAEGGGNGGGLLKAATGGTPSIKGKALMGAVKGGLSGIAEKVKSAFTGGGGGGGNKIKLTNIVEEIDIGAPVDLVYDQWTRFTEFPSFMKKLKNVEQISDEKTEWKAQVFWSHRSWEATILEQVPYERIVWRSKGQKGHVDGAVTFHELTPDLTKVVVVLAYHPQGLFERTGNIWRAQGRRARLELKHFRRHVMTEVLLKPDDVEGWHGEIHDGHVVEPDESGPDADDRDDTEQGTESEQDTGTDSEEDDYAESEEEPAESEEAESDEAEDVEEEPEEEPDEEPEEDDTDDAAEDERPRRGRARAGAGRSRGSNR